MKTLLLVVVGLAALGQSQPPEQVSSSAPRVPVLVELFTSEGCSSCPPADAFLQKLDQQPVPGAEMIVLSEHVTYWDHDGWKDPYSSSFYTDRQTAYSEQLHTGRIYTPEMVVDGTNEFVGSKQTHANEAFTQALSSHKVAVRVSAISFDPPNTLRAHVETDSLPASPAGKKVDVYVAVALNRAESQVSRGENAGHTLAHTAVVRSMMKVGVTRPGQSFVQDVELKLSSGLDPRNLRVIAFIQEAHQGKVIGATARQVSKT